MFEDFSFCLSCEQYDREKRWCKLFHRTMPCGCPYGGEQKPMLDLDALEVGFYAKGRDGNFYKVDLPVSFPVTKSINVLTGEIHYQNNYGRLKSMSMDELAVWLDLVRNNEDYPIYATDWKEWLKEEI